MRAQRWHPEARHGADPSRTASCSRLEHGARGRTGLLPVLPRTSTERFIVSETMADKIERSSLGTPAAKAARASVSDEHAARVVAMSYCILSPQCEAEAHRRGCPAMPCDASLGPDLCHLHRGHEEEHLTFWPGVQVRWRDGDPGSFPDPASHSSSKLSNPLD